MKRLLNAIRLGIGFYKTPQLIDANNLKVLSDLFTLIFKVANEKRPYMCDIGVINPIDGTDHNLVSLWAGSGAGTEPTKRIEELYYEVEKLKDIIKSQALELNKYKSITTAPAPGR